MTFTHSFSSTVSALSRRGSPWRSAVTFVIDALLWTAALIIAVIVRYDFEIDRVTWMPLLALSAGAALLQLLGGLLFHLYRGRHPIGSFEEVRALLWSVVAAPIVLGIPVFLFGTQWQVPRSAVFIATPIAFGLMAGVRYFKRMAFETSLRPGADAQNALVYGAGYMGSALVRRMLSDRESPYRPVGIIDDDPNRRRTWLHGVRVRGTRADLPKVAQETSAVVLVVAIAHADSALLRDIADAAEAAGLTVLVLPPFDEVVGGRTKLNDLRAASIEDLIGRHPVDTDVNSIADYLRDRRVLVTGAGGSIGAELCRQVMRYHPSELVMVDRDESGLQSTQLSISGHGLLDSRDIVLADIRDAAAMRALFADRRPEVVFHAAALKHLPLLEQYPDEAWKTNVVGTMNVLRAALESGVQRFVNISTDKAANPTSILGHSKRTSERLTAWAAQQGDGVYLSVRFGNVLGSRGSLIPTFASVIEADGTLTVTHPDATRYFMSITESCQLVVQAGAIGDRGEVLILDMGDPVRIVEVAERMIAMSGKDVGIRYTGLRPGEKLHEELVDTAESPSARVHPQIMHADVPPLDPESLEHEPGRYPVPDRGVKQ